ncbi:hypothetical protein C4K88_11515 [Arthrobacter pityocampae]|uniref:Uncharacterized protein n=1 Tax=Arthrobacter pityocampae TaxID=547334 RepID=A0A2S5IV10_9MICC|nr:hypothetical protein [Arthrobacter pityocampae]PPB48380.1 hypothetical protein C4K88_11515 [Arthrobacter pityocampae]
MAEKAEGFEWVGFTDDQAKLLDRTDHLGNNGWDSNGQTDELMPKHLARCAEAGLSIGQIVEAMQRIGYDKRTMHQLERWEGKRLTGKFGRLRHLSAP